MIKTTRFRVLGIVSVLCVVAAICWQMLPETSAQKNERAGKEDLIGQNSSKGAQKVPDSRAQTDNFDTITLNARRINVKSEDSQAERQAVEGFSGKRLHLVRYNGPIKGAWVDMLSEAGLEVIDYIPHYTYLVYGDYPSIQRLQNESKSALSAIEWDGPYRDEYKIQPRVYQASKEAGRSYLRTPEFEVQLVKDGQANASTLELLNKLQTTPIKGQQEVLRYVNLVVGLDENGVAELSKQPDVISINAYIEPRKFDERQNFILRGNLTGNQPTAGDWHAYLASKGFTQAQFDNSNFIVDLSDSGVDTATPANPFQFLLRRSGDPTLASRFAYSRLEGSPNSGSSLQGCDGHGNLNATIIAGYVPGGAPFNAHPHADAAGYRYGMGVNPFVKVGSSVIFDPDFFTSPNLPNLQSRAYQDGARISSNSWGSSQFGAYTTTSQTFDALVRDAQPASSVNPTPGNQEMVILFAAGNDGGGSGSMGAPGTGKNVFTVGASENVHPFGGSDFCGVADSGADSAHDIIGFSSRGPNDDGRVKPDIMLPGTHVTGGAAQNVLSSPVSGNGGALTCFTASGVCAGTTGGSGTGDFFPGGQQWYTASSGTSHSTPAVAGMAALVRQHFINEGLTPPSPAMTKAIIMNSAEYMTGVSANDNLPSNNQGMGLADLDRYFDVFAQSRILRDQAAPDTFSETGQSRLWVGNIVDTGKPFRVTLAWTDAPGSTTGNAFVNNLDLEVTVDGTTYKGNVFTGANSTGGGSADTRNNVESVFIPAGVSGAASITVKATNIAGDGIPQNADSTDQDFALVVSNFNQANIAVLSAADPVITTGNNIIEPSECNELTIQLTNAGNVAATGITATLTSNTPGVTITQPTSAYPNLAAEGGTANNTTPFQISTDGTVACFSELDLTLTVNYTGGTSPAVFEFGLNAGSPPDENYQFASSTGATLPGGGTLVAGSQADDAVMNITAPFAFSVYDTDVANGATLRVNTNGNLQIVSAGGSSREANEALPAAGGTGFGSGAFDPSTPVLMPYWDDLIMTTARDPGLGIFQQVTGTAPNRQWIVEWRAQSWNGGTDEGTVTVNFAIVFNEGSENFEYIYGLTGNGSRTGGAEATVGVQAATTGTQFTQFSFNSPSLTSGLRLSASRPVGSCVPGSGGCEGGGPERTIRGDYDGDGITDYTVYRPSTGTWWLAGSDSGFLGLAWGLGTDVPYAADLSGDRRTDFIIHRPNTAPGELNFYILSSDNYTFEGISWGENGDKYILADYDGDGADEIAAFRPSNSTWYIRDDAENSRSIAFGQTGDIPLTANFGDDGIADLAVFRPSDGTWRYATQSGSTAGPEFWSPWGMAGDIPVPADYDGDGRDDFAVFRPSNSFWYIFNSSNLTVTVQPWGLPTDIPVPGDYDGDGKYDVAVERDGVWYAVGSSGQVLIYHWGIPEDLPVPAMYLPRD